MSSIIQKEGLFITDGPIACTPIFYHTQAQMEEHFGFEEVTPVGIPRQEQVVVVGRIFCESAEGKINRASILLEVRPRLERIYRSSASICVIVSVLCSEHMLGEED